MAMFDSLEIFAALNHSQSDGSQKTILEGFDIVVLQRRNGLHIQHFQNNHKFIRVCEFFEHVRTHALATDYP